MSSSEINLLIDRALEGDKESLEAVLVDVQNLIFNLSLRMLGTIMDAEDALQDILVKVIANLSSFKKESSFSTWVYKIAFNHLINYKKSMFAKYPLNYEIYAKDISNGTYGKEEVDYKDVDEHLLSEELKLSCTNVMLQCLSPEKRCIFILGTMFHADSQMAGEILGISAENYRKKLSRVRKEMADFLSSYCGLSETGVCNCKKRVPYAIKQNRLQPENLEYSRLDSVTESDLMEVKTYMEEMDRLSLIFSNLPKFKSPQSAKDFIHRLMTSSQMQKIREYS